MTMAWQQHLAACGPISLDSNYAVYLERSQSSFALMSWRLQNGLGSHKALWQQEWEGDSHCRGFVQFKRQEPSLVFCSRLVMTNENLLLKVRSPHRERS